MKKISVSCVCLTILAFSTAQAPGGEEFPSCRRSDPNLDMCILNTINTLKPRFPSGQLSPEFIIDPLDPFYMPSITFGGRTRLTRITFSDIYISGATDFKLKDLKAHYSNGFLKVNPYVELDRIDVRAKFSYDAFPLAPLGAAQISLLNVVVRGEAKIRFYERNGTEYVKAESATFTFPKIRAGNLKLSLPFRGEKLRDTPRFLNFFIKAFSPPVVRIAYKVLERRIDEVHADLVNKFVKDVPASYFLPE